MTSYDGSSSAPGSAGRRRALGRGPGAAPVAPDVPPAEAEPLEETPLGPGPEPEADSQGSEPQAAPQEPEAGQDRPSEEPARTAPSRTPAPAGPSRAGAELPAADVPGPGSAAEEFRTGASSVLEAEAPAETERERGATPKESRGTVPSAAVDVSEAAGAGVAAPESEPETVPGPAAVVTSVPGPRPAVAAEATPAAAVTAPGSGSSGEAAGTAGGLPAEQESDDGVFKVRLSNFEGPFDLLLQLISKHKLDVTEVALSKVTDEFMAHIRAMGPDWDLDQTTEFLVVAATLLDLKAARLLPAAEVEDEADLALLEARDLLFARILQYRAYKQIADIFNRRTEDEARRYPRTVGLEPHHAELLPEVVISIGAEGFAKLAVKAMQPKPKPQVYVDHIHAPLVSVQEQAGIVVARLRELGEASFRVLVEDTDDTLTVVARFLALLELYREKAVALEQETALGDLVVRWTGGVGEEAPVVTDEFDRPPEDPDKSGTKTEEKA